MINEGLEERLAERQSRRTVLGTGAKLAYAAPLVAASFKLTASGTLAAVCPPGYTKVVDPDPGKDCCICDCTTADAVLDPETKTCISPEFGDVTDICLDCTASVQSLPR